MYTQTGDAGALALADALRENSSLVSLKCDAAASWLRLPVDAADAIRDARRLLHHPRRAACP